MTMSMATAQRASTALHRLTRPLLASCIFDDLDYSRRNFLSTVMSSNRRSSTIVKLKDMRGFGFVTFEDEQLMKDAIEGMNGAPRPSLIETPWN
ncbi:hypothetical protein U1Q18_002459 [Sarracenia purpurea var. burkii]